MIKFFDWGWMIWGRVNDEAAAVVRSHTVQLSSSRGNPPFSLLHLSLAAASTCAVASATQPAASHPPTHLSLATNATNSPQTDLKARLDVWGNLQPTNLRPLTRTLEDTDLFRFQSKFLTKLKFCSLSNIIGNKSCVLPANLMSAHNVSFCLNVHCTLLVKPRNQPTLPWWYQLLLAFLVQFYSDKLNDL